jgi:hypothetical protein
MKFASLLLASSLLAFTACSNSENNQMFENANSFEAIQASAPNAPQGGTKVHTVTNPQTGQAIYQIEFPASWQVDQAQGIITGPGSLEIRHYKGVSNVYTNDPFMQQSYAAAGKRVMPPLGAQGVLQQDLQQKASQMGMSFIKAYPMPTLAQKDRAYSDQLVSYGNPQKNFEVLASEWNTKDGKKVMVLLHYFEQASAGLVIWGYTTTALGANADAFETAKAQYIRALEGKQFNQQAIASYNQRESAALSQRDQQFQARMRNNQANFQATQRAYTESQNAINQSQMDIYRSQSESFDRGNQQIMNSIHDEQTMYNPANGETYQVEGYYDNYWMNGDGQYIGTDDQFYNPNMDQNMNNMNWEQGVSPY